MLVYIKFLTVAFIFGQIKAAQILVVPYPYKSHSYYLNAAAEELAIKGHEVYTVQPAHWDEPKAFTKLGYKVLKYPGKDGDLTLDSKEVKQEVQEIMLGQRRSFDIHHVGIAMINECENLLEISFIERLKAIKFDIVLVDGFPVVPCALLVPHLLGVPHIYVSTIMPWFGSRVPLLPSFVPHIIHPFTDNMNFIQRLMHFAGIIIMESELLNPIGISHSLSKLLQKHVQDPDITWTELMCKSSLFFGNRGPLLEYPAPSMPNTFYLEGLTARPGSPLPKKINDKADVATDGIIVVSFGSEFPTLPQKQVKVFLEAFSQRPELFFFRQVLDSNETLIPQNVRIMSWLPQNDLLAHPKSKLFITHCGNNGQYEALYHGVPMLGFPVGGDQHHNAIRLEAHGYGLTGDMFSVTSQEVLEKINKVLTEKSYRKRIQKAAKILHSRPMSARETAAYWVEHILEFGSDHLRSHALDMPLYQYLMLDILAFLLAIVSILMVLFCFCAKRFLHFKTLFKIYKAQKLKSS